ncbi:MAG: ATP-binding protein [Carnobacterium sp.]
MGKIQLEQVNEVSTKLIIAEIERSAQMLDEFVTNPSTASDTLSLQPYSQQIDYLFRHNAALTAIYLFDTRGNQIANHFPPKSMFNQTELSDALIKDPDFKTALTGKKIQNGQSYFTDQTSFINLYNPIYSADNQLVGLAVVPLNLEQLFKDRIQPDDTSARYPLMKNENMEVVMHPAKEQIGLNIVEGRMKKYPNLDYKDLIALDKFQKTHEKGSLSYYSYWWNQVEKHPVLKLNAFRWVKIGNARFNITNTTDFREENSWILQDTLISLGIIVLLLVVVTLLILLFLALANQRQIHNENQRLKERQQFEKEKHALEKSLMQESKLETIGLVTSGIVHDMNNFLTPLIGNLELLMEERKEDISLLYDLQDMHLAAQNGQRLSERVLHFSKDSDSTNKIQSLNDAIEDAIMTMTILIPKKVTILSNIQLHAEAMFEQDEVQVILYNLIMNAVQARSDTTITIALTSPNNLMKKIAEEHSLIYQQTKFAVIEVSDTSGGIDPAVEDKIFTPFFTTKSDEGGTGLGLFILASITKKNDWLVNVQSSPAGTTFSIGIPIL